MRNINVVYGRVVSLFSLSVLLVGCVEPNKRIDHGLSEKHITQPLLLAEVEVRNPSLFDRPGHLLTLPYEDLVSNGSEKLYRVESASEVYASQKIDLDADGVSDALFFSAPLLAGETKQFTIYSVETSLNTPLIAQAEVSHKVGGEWQDGKYIGGTFKNVAKLITPPDYTDHAEYIRYEGPGIESDLVGYRVYLDWRNGFDVFGKKTTEPVLQDVGQDGYQSYHEPAEWGQDILKVGKSLGLGGFGYWLDNKVERVSEVSGRSVEIIEKGGLYAAMRLNYENWKVADETNGLLADLSMQAGSRWVHTKLTTSKEVETLVTGIGKHEATATLTGNLNITGEAWSYFATWGAQSLSGDNLGEVIFFRKKDLVEITEDEHNHVIRLKVRDGQMEYKFGAVWQGETDGKISTEKAFIELLEQEVEKFTILSRTNIISRHAKAEKAKAQGPEYALYWASRLAESEINRREDSLSFGGFDRINKKPAVWAYTTGMLGQATAHLGKLVGRDDFIAYSRNIIDSYLEDDGRIKTYEKSKFNIDKINSGKLLLELDAELGDKKYRLAADVLRDQLRDHPRTTGGAYWHKKRYPGQLWLDGVYMSMPFLARYTSQFESGEVLGEVVHEFELAREVLRNPKTGLYYHAWDELKQQEWANPEHGRSAYFWSRGMGWYAMALVDTLDYIPLEQTELRASMLALLEEFTQSIVEHRSENGVWPQILATDAHPANYDESSGTGMFVYMLAKGVNEGYLPAKYRKVAMDAYEALVREFLVIKADGSVSVGGICKVAGLGYGRDGSFRYYMSEPIIENDPKGLVPFIFASIEISKFTEQKFTVGD